MAFMAVLESDLRALSTEARRRYPGVKDGAEHAILKVVVCLFKVVDKCWNVNPFGHSRCICSLINILVAGA